MQLFLTKSYEMGEHNGLNFINGEVMRINRNSKLNNLKVPHVSWNETFIKEEIKDKKILDKEVQNKDFYFIHSYMAVTEKKENTFAYCKYFDVNIPAIIKKDNIIGCQFHPEKSGRNGLNFLKKIISLD